MSATNSLWMRRMFDSASKKYVLLNTLMTFGMDVVWRRRAAEAILPKDKGKILDICTGTGDLALKIALCFPDQTVYGMDYSPEMLKVARERARALNCGNLNLTEGDCAQLPFESGSFDYVTVSFGFRNLSYSQDTLGQVFKEVRRALKAGGRFIIIETSQPPNIFIRKLFHFYAQRIVPFAGILFSGQREPYAYLGSSMVKFYGKLQLVNLIERAGFKEEKIISFMFGAILLSIFEKDN